MSTTRHRSEPKAQRGIFPRSRSRTRRSGRCGLLRLVVRRYADRRVAHAIGIHHRAYAAECETAHIRSEILALSMVGATPSIEEGTNEHTADDILVVQVRR